MPESVKDRPSRATEKVLLFAKQERYFWDQEAVRVPGGPGWNGSSFTSAYDHETKPGLGKQARQEIEGHNLWDYWLLGPEPCSLAHFAVFPTALVERCIKASTSAHGVCSACGAPWVRQVERGEYTQPPTRGNEAYSAVGSQQDHLGAGMPTRIRHLLGFSPSCACIATALAAGERNPDVMDALSTPSPAIVFDPFVGSGTTPLVARALGRVGIGCDLSWPYLQIARQRLGLAALAAWQGRAAAQPPCAVDDLPLFQETTQ